MLQHNLETKHEDLVVTHNRETNLKGIIHRRSEGESVIVVVFGHVPQELSHLLLPPQGPHSG